MKFVAILKQEGGCDYTIGCGVKVFTIEAPNENIALKDLKRIIKEAYSSYEFKLSEVDLFSVNERFVIDVNKWYKSFEDDRLKEQEEEIKTKELVELERLKKKYENN